MQSFAFSFRLGKVGSMIDWLLRSSCIYREDPMLRILNSLSSCGDVDVLLHGDSVVHEVLYVSLAYHRASIVGWLPCFP